MLANIKKYALEITVFFLAALRLLVGAWLPLLDKTEARYAEIARIMYDTGNWVTPQIDYGVPFWAKPPMSTWISAFSYQIFGVNEFAARFPSFVLQVSLIIFVAKALDFTKKQLYWFALILFTIPEYYIHCGVVSTDSSLLVGITFIMIGFWNSLKNNYNQRAWKFVTWLGVAIGMLAKGPIVLVLTVPPLFIWSCLYKGQLLTFFKKALWLPGMILAFVISFTWYYWAEARTPGFIDYFFVGEHYKRFFESGWQGDKYGFAKQQPMGMIWLFLLLFSIPWIQFIIVKVIKKKEELIKDKWVTYLWLWMLWTPVFFTISKSLIHTYTLPSMIPLGLLVMHYFESYQKQKSWFVGAMVVPVLVFIGFIGMNTFYKDTNWQNTDKHLLKEMTHQEVTDVYAWEFKSYSSQFYTSGKIKVIDTAEELGELMKQENPFYILSRNSHYKNMPDVFKEQLTLIGTNKKSQLFIYNP